MNKLTLLKEEQIFGEDRLDVLKQYGNACAITDFSILLGGFVASSTYTSEGEALQNRTGYWWTQTPYNNNARVVY